MGQPRRPTPYYRSTFRNELRNFILYLSQTQWLALAFQAEVPEKHNPQNLALSTINTERYTIHPKRYGFQTEVLRMGEPRRPPRLKMHSSCEWST